MVDGGGALKAVGIRLYCDCGYRFNEATVDLATAFAQNCYRLLCQHHNSLFIGEHEIMTRMTLWTIFCGGLFLLLSIELYELSCCLVG